MPPDDLNGLARSIDGAVHVLEAGVAGAENGLTDTLAPDDADALRGAPGASLTFASAIVRLLVLYELKKSGALTYHEFGSLKARLLGL